MNSTHQSALHLESAVDVLAKIRSGEVSAESYITSKIARCRQYADLNAFSWLDEDGALLRARELDAARARGETPGRLAGLALVVKDNIDTVGFPTSSGTESLRNYHPRNNAPVVQALLDEGAILLGKGNMHELAAGGTTANPVFGTAHNPYAPGRIPGGSSGGTAVAIRAGLASAGLGTDTAGSVRIPAALCGLTGLRPSTAPGARAYSSKGVVPLTAALDTIGPMGQTMADVTLLHSVITGSAVPAPMELHGVRIGVPHEHFCEHLEADIEQAFRRALQALQQAGVETVSVDPKNYIYRADEGYAALFQLGMHRDLAAFLQDADSDITLEQVVGGIQSPDVKHLYALMAPDKHDTKMLQRALAALNDARAAYAALFAEHKLSAIAFPTVRISAPKMVESFRQPDAQVLVNGEPMLLRVALTGNSRPTGALGVPGVSLPMGFTDTGLPIGLELDGLAGQDNALLALALAAEACLRQLCAG